MAQRDVRFHTRVTTALSHLCLCDERVGAHHIQRRDPQQLARVVHTSLRAGKQRRRRTTPDAWRHIVIERAQSSRHARRPGAPVDTLRPCVI